MRPKSLMSMAIATLALTLLVQSAGAQKKPPVKPGRDPGGVAIAILTTGITYTDPTIAACLARDGEGDLIGYDVADNDARPWSAYATTNPRGDALIRMIPCTKGIRIVPIRVDPKVPMTLGRAIDFAAKTPARIVVVPFASDAIEDFLPLGSAADAFRNVLVMVPAGDDLRDIDARPSFPAAFARAGKDWPALGNVVPVGAATGDDRALENLTNFGPKSVAVTVVEGASDRPAGSDLIASPSIRATIDAAWSLACSLQPAATPRDAAELKARLLSLARPKRGPGGETLLDPGCRK
ncbi:MAG TPA: hypothetical protein PK970_10805 [Hyphomicrobiaceae bacterium]|nr:hypothetical protein [Hyphomicrobiaceae bacterium]